MLDHAALGGGVALQADTGQATGPRVFHKVTDLFLEHLLSADRSAALQLVEGEVLRGVSVHDIYLHIVQPSMAKLGDLWKNGHVSVAAEHIATTIVQFIVTSLYSKMQRSSAHRGCAVVAGVRGEHHQLGSHLISDSLEADGWQVKFLGVDCPRAKVLAACKDLSPVLLALACTLAANLDELGGLIRDIRHGLAGQSVPQILVGGQALGTGIEAHHLAMTLGADGFASDLNNAVLMARTLTAVCA